MCLWSLSTQHPKWAEWDGKTAYKVVSFEPGRPEHYETLGDGGARVVELPLGEWVDDEGGVGQLRGAEDQVGRFFTYPAGFHCFLLKEEAERLRFYAGPRAVAVEVEVGEVLARGEQGYWLGGVDSLSNAPCVVTSSLRVVGEV